MSMQRMAIALTAATAVAVFAQQPDNNNANRDRPDRMRMARPMNYGNWVGRQVMEKEFMEKVGIKDEQAAKLKEEIEKIEARRKTTEETIDQLAAQQAEIAKKVLAEPGADIEEVMKLIERIGQLRTEQAKLSTQTLVVIRDTLTEEQRKKTQELIAAEGQRRAQERGVGPRREGGGERPGQGPGGGRRGDRPGGPGGPRPPAAAPDAPPRPDAPKGW